MQAFIQRILFLSSSILCLTFAAFSQISYGLVDATRTSEGMEVQNLIKGMPQEVLFGISIQENGDVLFGMNDKHWLNKIFSSDSYGISADIVSKDRYKCDVVSPDSTKMQRGFLLKPMYRYDIIMNLKELQEGNFWVKLGTLNPNFIKKEIEGNLVLIKDNRVCFYTHFINIERNVWHLLPMGLYTDTLLQTAKTSMGLNQDIFTYSKTVQVTVPFPQAKSVFNPHDIRPLYDALNLKDFDIRKIEIRAYSSVEGKEEINDTLMKERALAIAEVIKKFQPGVKQVQIATAENWIEFFHDIQNSSFSSLSNLPKLAIKEQLNNKELEFQLEPVLARHRKAVIKVYLEKKSPVHSLTEKEIFDQFKNAVIKKDIPAARTIQKEVAERIMDNKIPASYLNRLEIPMEKDYGMLLNDKLVYSYLFHNTSEYEALKECVDLKKLDPGNQKVNYNICALRLIIWEKGQNPSDLKSLLEDIQGLQKQGIASSLIKRMEINYYILQTAAFMAKGDYAAKNNSLQFIRDSYKGLNLQDAEFYSLAKYFSYYSRFDWAKEMVDKRIDKLDVSEDLVFYYINLEFSRPEDYASPNFQKAVLNAININRERFCHFFTPSDKGGASIQLLEFKELKKAYCQSCK